MATGLTAPLAAVTAALGMSTARWMTLPAEQVPVASLTPTQAVAPALWPRPRRTADTSGDPCIHVIELAGARLIQDGHHRRARAVRDGQATIAARVLRCPDMGAVT